MIFENQATSVSVEASELDFTSLFRYSYKRFQTSVVADTIVPFYRIFFNSSFDQAEPPTEAEMKRFAYIMNMTEGDTSGGAQALIERKCKNGTNSESAFYCDLSNKSLIDQAWFLYDKSDYKHLPVSVPSAEWDRIYENIHHFKKNRRRAQVRAEMLGFLFEK